MLSKIEITIEAIIHATEDIDKFFDAFSEIFDIDKAEFTQTNLVGHFENPIITIKTKISKKKANEFLKTLGKKLSKDEKNEIMEFFEERLSDSGLYLRLDKQEFVSGKISIREQDAIKVKIFTPVFNKKELTETYRKLFSEFN